MLILHENIYIYRRACIDKIPTLGQFFHGQMGIFQILLSHSSKIQYIGQNQVVLHFFKVTNWHILIFLRLLGSNKGSLKCAAKSKFFDESYCRCESSIHQFLDLIMSIWALSYYIFVRDTTKGSVK